MERQTKLRTCPTCGIPFHDIDTRECRGETLGASWCNGDHNCYICRMRSELVMAVACRNGGTKPGPFGPGPSTLAWFDSLPTDHPIRVQVEEDVAHLHDKLRKQLDDEA